MDCSPRLVAALALALVATALGAAGCGEDGGPQAPSLDEWADRVAQLCSDGTQEAIALPLPSTAKEVGTDSAAMAEIALTVRDGILPLGLPEGNEDAASAYVDELSADAKLLLEVSKTAKRGGDYLTPLSCLDESAGETALELGVDECAAFANAVARTP